MAILRLWLALIAVLSAGTAVLGAGTAVARATGLRTGCDSTRPAVAYRSGGRPVVPAPPNAPIPCVSVVSGRAAESATVAVLPSGRIVYAPLILNNNSPPTDDGGPAVVTASDNGGQSWLNLESGDSASPARWTEVPPWMHVDPQTHRIWFATALPDLCGGDISWSDDGGRKWSANPLVGCPAMGSERVLEGPAPAGGAQPSGYPHVVYYCANATDLSQSTLWCYRSLDGGHTFAFVGSFPDPTPPPGCSAEHPARPGAVGPDGDLYFPVYMCGQLYVAVSRDEGASWQLVHVAASNVAYLYTTSVATDDAGNVYLAWITGAGSASSNAISGPGVPTLSVSRDHGASWSRPVAVGPPAVRNAQMIALTAAGPAGQVAISYLANTNASALVDGWLSETRDALNPDALWWAAPLNDPRTPLINTTDPTTFGDRLFFFTDTFAPDGQAWAAFHCAKTAACPAQRIGVVGRLATPTPASGGAPTNQSTTSTPCVDTRLFVFKLHHARGARVVRVRVFVNGARRIARRGRNIHSVAVNRLPQGRFQVRIVAIQNTGTRTVSMRTYTGCTKSRPTNHGHRRTRARQRRRSR